MYHETFAMFAAYNEWANRRLYEAAGALTPEEFAADRGVFFGSMMGTLNHLLAADRIWLKRFTGSGDAPDRLDAILFPEFADLEKARQAEDSRIVAWIDGVEDAAFAANFTYRPITDPRLVTQRLAPAVFHFFNHQAHHRGQAHAILTGYGREAPALDLVYFQRLTGMG